MSDFSINNALTAYNNSIKLGQQAGIGKTEIETPGFSSMVEKAIDTSMQTLRAGERASIGAIMDEVTLDELSIAVSSAESTLRTAVAVRDKVISAYQDIIKMPI